MPHWNEQGEETALCQLCGRSVPSTNVQWRPDLTSNKSAGNVCLSCIDRLSGKPMSLAEHCSKESGYRLGSQELRQYINRHYGHG